MAQHASGMCLGIADGIKTPGALVVLWQFNGNANQLWFTSEGVGPASGFGGLDQGVGGVQGMSGVSSLGP